MKTRRRVRLARGAPGARLVSRDSGREVQRVAVLGGDGRSYLRAALRQKADLLITGDVDHHTALEARAQGIALLDVGHWACEACVSSILAEGLRSRLGDAVEVLPSEVDTQPFLFV